MYQWDNVYNLIDLQGNYSIQDMDLTMDFHLPFIPYGNYKCDAILLRKLKRMGCLQLFIDVVPKRNWRSNLRIQ